MEENICLCDSEITELSKGEMTLNGLNIIKNRLAGINSTKGKITFLTKCNNERLSVFKRIYDENADFVSCDDLCIKWIATEIKELRQKPTTKEGLSHAKQMVLVEKLRILKYLDELNFTTKSQAKIISLLISKDEQNTREYLTYGKNRQFEPKNVNKKKYFYNTHENIEAIDSLMK